MNEELRREKKDSNPQSVCMLTHTYRKLFVYIYFCVKVAGIFESSFPEISSRIYPNQNYQFNL